MCIVLVVVVVVLVVVWVVVVVVVYVGVLHAVCTTIVLRHLCSAAFCLCCLLLPICSLSSSRMRFVPRVLLLFSSLVLLPCLPLPCVSVLASDSCAAVTSIVLTLMSPALCLHYHAPPPVFCRTQCFSPPYVYSCPVSSAAFEQFFNI